jgi:hypothetical protein
MCQCCLVACQVFSGKPMLSACPKLTYICCLKCVLAHPECAMPVSMPLLQHGAASHSAAVCNCVRARFASRLPAFSETWHYVENVDLRMCSCACTCTVICVRIGLLECTNMYTSQSNERTSTNSTAASRQQEHVASELPGCSRTANL